MSVVFGTIDSDRTVVVLVHKHFSSWLCTFCNCISIIMICTYANMSTPNITAYIKSSFTFYSFTSLLIVLCQFYSCITLGNVDLGFSLIFLSKANDGEGRITWPDCLYHQCNQSTHMTEGMTVMSLSASLQHKTSAATFCPCQSTLNWKLSHFIYAKSR